MRYLFLMMICVVAMMSCGETDSKGTVITTDTQVPDIDMHRLPELKTVDSIDIHFFPDINDQKVYTRFGLNDTAAIHLFTLDEINQAFVDKTNCEYDTKFFCFAKGQVVKTLYVAALKDSCHFIGFIKSGGVAVKVLLSDSAASLVNVLRKKSGK